MSCLTDQTREKDDFNRDTRTLCLFPGDLSSSPVQLNNSVLHPVQLESVATSTEAVCEDNVGPGLDKPAVQRRDTIDMVCVPHLRRIAGLKSHIEIIGACRAISKQPRARCKQFCYVRQRHLPYAD